MIIPAYLSEVVWQIVGRMDEHRDTFAPGNNFNHYRNQVDTFASQFVENFGLAVGVAVPGDNSTLFQNGQSVGKYLKIFIPTREAEIVRCWELLQRSYQLNLCTRRYSMSEFIQLLAEPTNLCLALTCSDKFGDFGIIGFSNISLKNDEAFLSDLVLSCRVAQKRVEHSFLAQLSSVLQRMNHTLLRTSLFKTPKNGPLLKVFQDFPFSGVCTESNIWNLQINLNQLTLAVPVMTVEFDSSIQTPK